MIPAYARNTYQKIEAQGYQDPAKVIQLLYDRTLKHLLWAGEGIEEKNPCKRGENLGKVISIISELNAALDMERGGEAAAFLRGLYVAILVELPKVAITQDVEILKRSYRYIKRLNDIWEQTVMKDQLPGGPDPKKESTRPSAPSLSRQPKGLSMSI